MSTHSRLDRLCPGVVPKCLGCSHDASPDHRPFLCRLGVHRTVRTHNPQDMTIRSKTCGRCGHVKDISGYLTLGNADGVAYGKVFLSGGH